MDFARGRIARGGSVTIVGNPSILSIRTQNRVPVTSELLGAFVAWFATNISPLSQDSDFVQHTTWLWEKGPTDAGYRWHLPAVDLKQQYSYITGGGHYWPIICLMFR